MIAKIKVGAKKRPFYIGMRSLRKITKGEALTTLGDMMDNLDLDTVCEIAVTGFEEGARKNKDEIDFTEEDVMDWLDDDFQLALAVTQEFAQQTATYLDGTKKNKLVAVDAPK